MAEENSENTLKGLRGLKTEGKTIFWCFVLSGLLWFLTAMNEYYSQTIRIKTHFLNIPENQVFANTLPGNLKLEVNATGWDLLAYALKPDSQEVNLDLGPYANRKYMLSGRLRDIIKPQLTHSFTINDIMPDTIYLERVNRSTKKVPLHLSFNLNMKPQIGLSRKIIYNPDSIEISGPSEVIANVTSISSKSINYEVGESISKILYLKEPFGKNVSFLQKKISIQIKVDRLTENKMTIPVKFINESRNTKIRLLPEVVEVTYSVPVSLFNQINEDEFEVVVDAKKPQENILQNKTSPLKLYLIRKPEFCYRVSINPQFVNYIITR